MNLEDIFSIDFLNSISFESSLNVNLSKYDVSKFDMNIDFDKIVDDVENIVNIANPILEKSGLKYRLKSISSINLKINKYKSSSHNARLCFNDLVGIRVIVDSFDDLVVPDYLKIVDLRNGKKNDDGYRAIYLYYSKSNRHYPIEIQIWKSKDEQFYNWQHIHCYKKESDENMRILRYRFDTGIIKSEQDFIKELEMLHYCDYIRNKFKD